MASDSPVTVDNSGQAGAHPGTQKMDLTDTVPRPEQVHGGAYAALVYELQNTPELQGFFNKPGAEPARQPGSDGLGQLELYDNPATASAALLAQVDQARNDKADQKPVSDPKKDQGNEWLAYILGHDHSRDGVPKKDQGNEWLAYILAHDHSRDVRPEKDQGDQWVKYILEHDHSRDVRNK